MCVAKKFHCIIEARMMAKTMRTGCLKGATGNELGTGPSMNGSPARPSNVEYTGEYLDSGASVDISEDETGK